MDADLLPVLVRIQSGLDTDLRTATLARDAGLSESTLHRRLREVTGETPRRHVERLRLETIDLPLPPDGGLGQQTIPGGTFAVTTYVGPFALLGLAYGAIAERLMAHADAIAFGVADGDFGGSVEWYRTGSMHGQAARGSSSEPAAASIDPSLERLAGGDTRCPSSSSAIFPGSTRQSSM